jgi:hypothetical protein
MAFIIAGAKYQPIPVELSAADNTAILESARIGGTQNLNYPAAVRGTDWKLDDQIQPDLCAPDEWTQTNSYSWGPISNLVTDPSIGGQPGQSQFQGYNFAGVDSGQMENFELDGRRGEFPMQAATGYGPVGFHDHAGILGASLAQDAYDFPTPYQSAVSVVTGF